MKQAQFEIGAIITLIMFAIIVVPMLFMIVDAFQQNQCADYISQINSLNNKIQTLEQNSLALQQQLNISEEKYQELINSNVTKKDIWDLQNEINQTRGEIIYLKNEFKIMNSNTVSSYNILIKNYRIAIIINFVLIFFFAIDWALLAFNIDVKKYIIKLVKRCAIYILSKFRKKEKQ